MISANAMHKQTVIPDSARRARSGIRSVLPPGSRHRGGMTTVHESAGHHTSGWLRMLTVIALPALVWASTSLTHAQSYPGKTIRMIVPIAPGGGTDTMARLISQRLSE